MPPLTDLTGQRFGRLTVVRRAGCGKFRQVLWLVRCDCGNVRKVANQNLRLGTSKSCGCLRAELASKNFTKHGMSRLMEYRAEYHAWKDARQRCTNRRNAHYGDYGGRGIKFLFKSFEEFFTEIGKRPPNPPGWKSEKPYWTLDRIDNNSHYQSGNVRWASHGVQMRNTRSWAARNRKNSVEAWGEERLSKKFVAVEEKISEGGAAA
jgi:hypothetical protein